MLFVISIGFKGISIEYVKLLRLFIKRLESYRAMPGTHICEINTNLGQFCADEYLAHEVLTDTKRIILRTKKE